MDMEYSTLYSRVVGRAPFRSEEINDLLIAAPDTRLVDALLQQTRFIGVERTETVDWVTVQKSRRRPELGSGVARGDRRSPFNYT